MMQAFSAIIAIAKVSWIEALRDRILYGLLAFCIGLILLSAVLSNLTLGWAVRIVTNLSLSTVSLSGSAMALLLGVRSVAGEVERKTAYPVLARPISRWTYVLGRYLGVMATVSVNVLLMYLAATAMIAAYSHEGSFQYAADAYLATLAMMMLRFAIIAAIAVLFSSFTSSTVAFIASVGMVIAGSFTSDLRFFLGQSESAFTQKLGDLLYWTLPDLSTLETMPLLVHGKEVLTAQVGTAAVYGSFYLLALLTLASWLFESRDLP